jgi:hypothetical protein
MGPFYEVTVELDGRSYAGQWSLRMGGVVHVACVLGADHAEIGPEKPEAVAARLLQGIIVADRQRRAEYSAVQADEMATLRRRRRAAEKRFAGELAGGVDPTLEALRRLVQQIEGAGYEDRNGDALEQHPAFLQARDIARDEA